MIGTLFDLDGTILTDGIFLPQATCITEAITAVYGFNAGNGPDHVPPEVQTDWTGKTDTGILADICANAGIPNDEIEAGFDDWYKEYLRLFAARCPTNLRAKVREGMPEVLEQCVAIGAVRVTTGNIYEVAKMKLVLAGVAHLIDLTNSGFGNQTVERKQLVKLAAEGLPDAVCVGDTWRDIKAAHDNGFRAIGVATERFSMVDLHAAGADFCVDSQLDRIPGKVREWSMVAA